jgi:hypothetical protein
VRTLHYGIPVGPGDRVTQGAAHPMGVPLKHPDDSQKHLGIVPDSLEK